VILEGADCDDWEQAFSGREPVGNGDEADPDGDEPEDAHEDESSGAD
jgi:hypothetical protein